MPQAVIIEATGGPEVLRPAEHEPGAPGEGQVRLRQTAIGVNYIDVYHRTGLYPLPGLPAIIGMEGAGVVEAVGPGVSDLAPGDRVAYACPPTGAYASVRLAPAAQMVKLPEAINDEVAASIMLKGMTAQYLLHDTAPVRAGDFVLVHAAAGGVGLLLCQWAKHLGCTVIGTASTEEKAALARAHGCDHPIVTRGGDFAARVKEITGGAGCRVIYDGIGRDSFAGSMESLAMCGRLVSFGQASGPIEPIAPGLLSAKSASLSRPVLFHYTAKRPELLRIAGALFEVIASGAVKVEPPRRYALAEAAQAHADLEGRRTTGSLVLVP
ncbi:quinone oxidoreductase [Roseococcus sp. SDR]|uniref:quinone oxidoreductase family protein n=1 Tax=Roseococcus sp. SDR TaxID=2835532 RepID=UPI001BCAA309|nr:quinone oxidoreductase [Roseococcus sp. SDR]MBS7792306.1 quinone oxidoreductase [Roseococcus sp. SDR]MBV1847620.1 quinone oxidoreductase [Roseococcus sp. SDR]